MHLGCSPQPLSSEEKTAMQTPCWCCSTAGPQPVWTQPCYPPPAPAIPLGSDLSHNTTAPSGIAGDPGDSASNQPFTNPTRKWLGAADMIKSYLKICFLIPAAVALRIIAPSGSFPEHGGAAGGSGCLPPFPRAAVPAPSDRTFLYQLHLCQKRPLSVLSPSGLRFLFCFTSCMDFLSPQLLIHYPRLLLFFVVVVVCACGAAQMLLHTHTLTHSLRRCCFPSALRCPQLLTIAAFFSCTKTLYRLPAVLPTSLLNSLCSGPFCFQDGWGGLEVAHLHFSRWDVMVSGDLCHPTLRSCPSQPEGAWG